MFPINFLISWTRRRVTAWCDASYAAARRLVGTLLITPRRIPLAHSTRATAHRGNESSGTSRRGGTRGWIESSGRRNAERSQESRVRNGGDSNGKGRHLGGCGLELTVSGGDSPSSNSGSGPSNRRRRTDRLTRCPNELHTLRRCGESRRGLRILRRFGTGSRRARHEINVSVRGRHRA